MQRYTLILVGVGLLTACGGMQEELLGSSQSALGVSGWLNDVKVPGQHSEFAPGLAQFGNYLHMVHNGSSDPKTLWWSKFNGAGWSTNVKLSGMQAAGGPGLAVLGNRLYMVFRKHGTKDMVITSTTGGSWTTPVKVVSGRYAPALTEYQGKLYMAYCAPTSTVPGSPEHNNWVRVEVFEGGQWKREHNIRATAAFVECRGVAIAGFGGKLHVVWNLLHHDWLWGDEYYMGEATWTPGNLPVVKHLPMKSRNPPSLVVCNNTAHLVHSGSTSNKLWWSYQYTNGTGWSTEVKVPNQSSHAGAGLGCYAGYQATMVHNAAYDDQLWWSEYAPGYVPPAFPGGADTVAPTPPYEPPDTFPGGADTATNAR